jgi:predicted outer membrane repeat protein
MLQRITTIITSLALVGAIFAGVPSSARADAATIHVGIAGADYTTAVAGCRDLEITILAGSEVDVAEDIADASVDADTGGTIYLCPGTYHFLTPAVMERDNITLKGAGATKTILDGGNTSRIILTEFSLVVENLTMRNARGDQSNNGGAVLAYGTVDATNVVFSHNFSDTGGGAIAALDEVTVQDSTFTNNTTADRGGAIASGDTVTVENSTFTNNSSIADSECIGGGGAIAAAHDVIASDSLFVGNSAVLGPDTNLANCGYGENVFGGFGGAIAALGFETITDSKFVNNKAALVGGAVFAANTAETRSNVLISGSTFSGNDLLPLTGNWALGGTYIRQAGSAVADISEWGVTIITSTFSNNGHRYASSNLEEGMGIEACGTVFGLLINVDGSAFNGNSSVVGGGLCAYQQATVTDSTFTGNFASLAGAAIVGGLVPTEGVYLAVQHSTFVKNRALIGGAIYAIIGDISDSVFKQNSVRIGGARRGQTRELSGTGGAVHSLLPMAFTNNLFTRNRAQRAGGAVYVESRAAEAIGLMVGNRFIGNSGGKAGGAVGYNLADTAALPTRSQLRAAQRANRFSGNTAARGPLMGGVKSALLFN